MTATKLSPQMLFVLADIAVPSEDADPFPPAHTLKALERRGLIAFEKIEEPQNEFELMCGRGLARLKVTAAGLDALDAANV